MSVAIVTGSAGLIGSEAVRFFSQKGFDVVGIDNDMRSRFFGEDASTKWCKQALLSEVRGYTHVDEDIRDESAMKAVFSRYRHDITAIIHTASQPSHDWAARDPMTDFSVNANGTLVVLEMFRKYCPRAAFIFTSTNKVYGDTPNRLPLVEQDLRWELIDHPYAAFGIDESMSVDNTLHSLFGCSKLAADVLVQEYGRYFGLNTVSMRGGCLTGPNHSGTQLHGFLAYLVKCAVLDKSYTVFGYKGKQVRDNLHSYDLVNAMWHYCQAPRPGEIYNLGGGRFSNCSMLEAIKICEELTGNPMKWVYQDDNRIGDHQWWISDTRKFQSHYPSWRQKYNIGAIMEELVEGIWARSVA
jgi:CDP-paratose 2-epimerase